MYCFIGVACVRENKSTDKVVFKSLGATEVRGDMLGRGSEGSKSMVAIIGLHTLLARHWRSCMALEKNRPICTAACFRSSSSMINKVTVKTAKEDVVNESVLICAIHSVGVIAVWVLDTMSGKAERVDATYTIYLTKRCERRLVRELPSVAGNGKRRFFLKTSTGCIECGIESCVPHI